MRWQMAQFGIERDMRVASELPQGSDDRTGRLVDICRTVGATTYLSGSLAQRYLDLSQFDAAGIAVDTAAGYLAACEAAYLVFSVPYFAFSDRKRSARNKKYYPIDTGLRRMAVTRTGTDRGITPTQVSWEPPTDRHHRALEEFYETFPQAQEALLVGPAEFEAEVLADLAPVP